MSNEHLSTVATSLIDQAVASTTTPETVQALTAAGLVSDLPPSQRDIMVAALAEIAANPIGRNALRIRLEIRMRLTDVQKNHREGATATLWSLRYRHAIADLAMAGLILKDGAARKTPLEITDSGKSTLAAEDVSKAIGRAIADARRGGAAKRSTRTRLGAPLPPCGVVIVAMLECLAAADKPIGNAELAEAVAAKLAIATHCGPAGHDMLKARIASSSHRLWRHGLIERIGNGRRFRSYITARGRKSVSDPSAAPIKLPTQASSATGETIPAAA